MEVFCYVCNKPTSNGRQNLTEIRSQHSSTPISEFLKRFLGDILSQRDIDDDVNCICSKCMNQIDVYDWMCVTTSEKEKELIDLFLATEATYTRTVPKVEIQETETDVDGTNSDCSVHDSEVYVEPFSIKVTDEFNDDSQNDGQSESDSDADGANDGETENVTWNTRTEMSCLVVSCFSNFTQIEGTRWRSNCNLCNKMVRYREKINSNLKNHLKTRHSKIWKGFEAENERKNEEKTAEKEKELISGFDADANADDSCQDQAQFDSSNQKASQSTTISQNKRQRQSDSYAVDDGETEIVNWNTRSVLSYLVVNSFSSFTQIEGKSWEANCNLCNKMVRYREKINSNLKNHLKKKHPHIWDKLEEESERKNVAKKVKKG